MKNFYVLRALFCVFMLTSSHIFAQNTSWHFISEKDLEKAQFQRTIAPENYRVVSLNMASFGQILNQAPERFSDDQTENNVFIELPLPDGSSAPFRVEKWSVFHPGLAQKFPEIQTFIAYGLNDPTAVARLDLTPNGFHGMIRSKNHPAILIDPYAPKTTEYYQVYYRSELNPTLGHAFQCLFNEANKNAENIPLASVGFAEQSDCTLRVYRLAVACTGEYATYHGGTVTSVLSAITTTINRVNGIFEDEMAISLQLVANNDQLIFLDPTTDPYTNSDGVSMLSENQTTVDNLIGSANYDIGHVFSTGGGGVAYLGSVCNNNIKAGGVTGHANPVGDAFDVDYVAHEMGHQFGATHTQNNDCNRSATTSMEPGSASTIMGYAGVCSPNIQTHSDDYFHAVSLQQIAAFIAGNGSCAAQIVTGNNAPTANAGADFTIPAGTPFALTGTGNDPDGTANLTFTWEQMDPEFATMPPLPSNATGPLFRSQKPQSEPVRFFPNLADLSNNISPQWEVLPEVERTLHFRFTVRDHYSGAGCTAEDDMVLNVVNTGGPFVVTAPNTALNWPALSAQTVTWNVAATDLAPIDAPTVDILLSLDGGQSWPVTLAAGVPNDGAHNIMVPNNQTTSGRIMVKGANHAFFDISDQNFAITPPQSNFTLVVSPLIQTICAPNDGIYDIQIGSTGGFSELVQLDISGLPAGATATFSNNPVQAPGSATLTLSNLAALAPGAYTLTISAAASTGIQTETLGLIISVGAPEDVLLVAPADGSDTEETSPVFTWQSTPTAVHFALEVATDANFSGVILSENNIADTSFQPSNPLPPGTALYWRVRAINECGNGAWSETRTFATINQICQTFTSQNVPMPIPGSGTPVIHSTLDITPTGIIDDVNIKNLYVGHTWVNDLVVSVTSPSGTSVTLLNQLCSSEDDIDLNFDDESTNTYLSIPCPPVGGGVFQPLSPLSAFNGEPLSGTWTLTVQDLFNQDGGELKSWGIEICYQTIASQPLFVSVSGTDVVCNGQNNGSATALITGGIEPYQLLWSNDATSNQIAGLSPGTYTVTVTDATGTTATDAVQISEPPALFLSLQSAATTCGNDNGQASANLSGGTPGYAFNWSNGATTDLIQNLPAGNYSLTVTDDKGCTQSATTQVGNSAPLSLSLTGAAVQCAGGSDGMISAITSGGSGTYNYLWSNGQNTPHIENIPSGNYAVTVTDATDGCVATSVFSVSEPAPIQLELTMTTASCGQSNGTALALATGGSGGFEFIWSNGQNMPQIENLPVGDYAVTVTDSHQCSETKAGIISGTSPISVEVLGEDIQCHGASDGFAAAQVVGGTGTYEYIWSNGQHTPQIENLTAGMYTVTVTDPASGCSDIGAIVLTEPNAISVTTTTTSATCGAQNGTASVAITGGMPGFDILWSTGDNTLTISNLPAGMYSVTVTDQTGCSQTQSATVSNIDGISATAEWTDVNCAGVDEGTATIYVTGGSGEYAYSWSNGQHTPTVQNLSPGNYTATVTDIQSGCLASVGITISAPDVLILSVTATEAHCGEPNGTVSTFASGGTPGYQYSWSNGQNVPFIENLAPGSYSVTVTDEHQCTASKSIEVTGTEPVAVDLLGSGPSCFGGNDGFVEAFPSGGSGQYAFIWSNGQNGSMAQGLSAGNYRVTVVDMVSDCSEIGEILLSQPTPIQISIAGTAAQNGADGSAESIVSGGTPPYSWLWSNGDQTSNTDQLAAGTYDLTVTDARNCTSTASVTIQEVNPGCLENEISLTLLLDNYPGETTWELRSENDEIIAGGGPYSTAGELIEESFCLPDGCYHFVINDVWGDGICCAYGQGYFELLDQSTGEILATGGAFGSRKTAAFCLPFAPMPCTFTVINENDFESGWGIWQDGGSDARRSAADAVFANSGNYCVRLRDNSSTSVITTDPMDLTGFEEVRIDFSYYVRSFENVEDFWLQVSLNGGLSFNTIEEWSRGDEFDNNVRNNGFAHIPGPFTPQTVFRFRCDASGNSDWVYLDDIVISGCSTGNFRPAERLAEPPTIMPQNRELSPSKTSGKPALDAFNLTLFPNPVNDLLTIQWRLPEDTPGTVTLADLSGKTLLTKSFSANSRQMEWRLSGVPPGVYLVIFNTEQGTLTRKITVVR